jgi:hypothetical protein
MQSVHLEKMRIAYRILVGKPQKKTLLVILGCRWRLTLKWFFEK